MLIIALTKGLVDHYHHHHHHRLPAFPVAQAHCSFHQHQVEVAHLGQAYQEVYIAFVEAFLVQVGTFQVGVA